ncbi:hypothetical protein ACWEK5_46390 [Rhodococcus koreensis]
MANVVIPTPGYVRFATHYGFAPDFCHANDPQSEGIVENRVGYAQRGLAVPVFTEAAVTGTTIDIPTANAAAQHWCTGVNARIHCEICAIPDKRLRDERELLHPLSSPQLQIGPPPVTCKLDRLSCVRFASAPYSAPTRLGGSSVALVQTEDRLVIVEPATRQVVTEHDLTAIIGPAGLSISGGGPLPSTPMLLRLTTPPSRLLSNGW